MKIREVNENKKQFIALLLLADEQESMVDRYLEKGTMYVLEDGNVKAECVVTDESMVYFKYDVTKITRHSGKNALTTLAISIPLL